MAGEGIAKAKCTHRNTLSGGNDNMYGGYPDLCHGLYPEVYDFLMRIPEFERTMVTEDKTGIGPTVTKHGDCKTSQQGVRCSLGNGNILTQVFDASLRQQKFTAAVHLKSSSAQHELSKRSWVECAESVPPDQEQGQNIFTEKIHQLQRQLADKESENQREINLSKQKDDIIKQLKSDLRDKNDELLKQRALFKETCKRKDKNIQDLTTRLSAEMGTKVSADESSLENVNIKDRPMNIASEYELLCSNQWLTAKTELDDLHDLTEEIKLKFLCDVLVIGLNESTKIKNSLVDDLGRIITKPGIKTLSDVGLCGAFNLPDRLMQNLFDLARQIVEKTDLQILYKSIFSEASAKMKDLYNHNMPESEGMVDYIKGVSVFTWKMVLQRPPMSFGQHGIGRSWLGENKQEVFWSSSDPLDPNSKVAFYIHPTLYHGEAMMVKGRVFLSKTGHNLKKKNDQ